MAQNEAEFWDAFHAELAETAASLGSLKERIGPGDKIPEYFLQRLIVACENARGSVLLGKAGLVAPLSAVSRALFESLIVTYWSSLSDENANKAIATGYRELLRIMRNSITSGRAQVVHKVTGADESAIILNHPMMKEARRPKRLEEMAREAKMKNVYDMLYGLMSLFAHGTATELQAKSALSGDPPIYENMSLARSCFKGIALICTNRIDGKQTGHPELESILKVKFAP
jgi:hypothetical protein